MEYQVDAARTGGWMVVRRSLIDDYPNRWSLRKKHEVEVSVACSLLLISLAVRGRTMDWPLGTLLTDEGKRELRPTAEVEFSALYLH